MKDLKAFLEAISDDKKLAEKVNEAKDVKEMVKIANEAGYSVTEDEMNDFLMQAVAGGWEFELPGGFKIKGGSDANNNENRGSIGEIASEAVDKGVGYVSGAVDKGVDYVSGAIDTFRDYAQGFLGGFNRRR